MADTPYYIIERLAKKAAADQDGQAQLINTMLKTKRRTLDDIITLYERKLITDNTAIILLTANRHTHW